MKAFSAATLIIAVGCGGITSIDDGADAATSAAPEQQLSGLLPTWCPQICAKLSQCNSARVDVTCVNDCSQAMSNEFLGRGSSCAQLGLDFVTCVDHATCSDLANAQICEPNATTLNATCGTNSTSPPPTANSTGSTVTCQTATVSVPSANAAVGATVCDSTETDCSDRHTYRITCTNQGNDSISCECYLDNSAQMSFTTTGTNCPTNAVVNSACEWQLVQ